MPPDELKDLARSVAERGLDEPIWLLDGMILDGRNRYRACLSLNITPAFREWSGDSPLSFVIAKNLHRRHLNTSQRAMIAARIIPLIEAETRARMKMGKTLAASAARVGGRAADLAGKTVKVSGDSVERARKAQTAAPEVVERVKAGRMTVTAAARLSELTPEKQLEAIRAAEAKAPPRDARTLKVERMMTLLRKVLKGYRAVNGAEKVCKHLERAEAEAGKL